MRQHNNLHREYRRNISLIEGSEATLDDLSDDPQYAKFRAKIGKRDAESLRGLTFRLSLKVLHID